MCGAVHAATSTAARANTNMFGSKLNLLCLGCMWIRITSPITSSHIHTRRQLSGAHTTAHIAQTDRSERLLGETDAAVGGVAGSSASVAWVEACCAAGRGAGAAGVENESNDESVQTQHLGENENQNHAHEELQWITREVSQTKIEPKKTSTVTRITRFSMRGNVRGAAGRYRGHQSHRQYQWRSRQQDRRCRQRDRHRDQ